MQNKELFNKYNKGEHWRNHPEIYAEYFSEFLKKKNFKGLLADLGCGNGRDINVFSKKGFDVIGIDILKEAIESNKKTYPKCKFEVQDILKLDFKDSSVAAIFMINVIHYVDKIKAINEIFRIMKHNSYAFIHLNLSIIDEDGNTDYTDSEESILKLVSKFKIIEKRYLKRVDELPKKHTHKILELILQKI